MAGTPEFRHIHCSSRNDRSAADLEADVDHWMQGSSIITMTEVANDNHAAKLREKGWGYWNAKKNHGQDDAAIAWRKDTWYNPWHATRKLTTRQYRDVDTGQLTTDYVHACGAVLKHTKTGSKLLVTVARLPDGLSAASGWNELEAGWRARKAAYMECNITWAAWTEQVQRENHCDGIIVVGDWNLDLKADWVRAYLGEVWGPKYHLTWKHFPTFGSGLGGNRIIDGTLARHLDTLEGGAILMDKVRSSDHRPYKEQLIFKPGEIQEEDVTGDRYVGEIWWGFGDYEDDEIYTIEKFVAGAAGGETL